MALTPELYDFGGHYLIVLTHPTENYDPKLLKFVHRLRKRLVTNVHILFPLPNLGDLLLTVTEVDRCDDLRLTYLNCSEIEDWSQYNLFKPTKDFGNCSFKAVVVETEPFVVLEHKRFGVAVTGIEIDLLRLLEKRLNFSTFIMHPPKEEGRGTILPNGATSGAIGTVSNDQLKFENVLIDGAPGGRER